MPLITSPKIFQAILICPSVTFCKLPAMFDNISRNSDNIWRNFFGWQIFDNSVGKRLQLSIVYRHCRGKRGSLPGRPLFLAAS